MMALYYADHTAIVPYGIEALKRSGFAYPAFTIAIHPNTRSRCFSSDEANMAAWLENEMRIELRRKIHRPSTYLFPIGIACQPG